MSGLRNLPYGKYGYGKELDELGDKLRYAKERLRDMEARLATQQEHLQQEGDCTVRVSLKNYDIIVVNTRRIWGMYLRKGRGQ
jgi:hypothetical protein